MKKPGSAFIDNTRRPVVIVGAAAVYIVLWIFVAGGIIDRFARDRPTRTVGFFASSGVFFFRFLRLAAVQWVVYAVLLDPSTRCCSIGSTRTSFTRSRWNARRSPCGSPCTSCSAAWSPPGDRLRLREGACGRRRSPSMFSAIAEAIRFVGRNAGAAASLFLANFALFVAVIRLYALVAPRPAAPAPRCGSPASSVRSTCWRGCG